MAAPRGPRRNCGTRPVPVPTGVLAPAPGWEVPVARPQLRPGLRRLWRDSSTLQLGLSPTHGVVLAGLRAGDDVVLAALDGRHDLRELYALARASAIPTSRVDDLVRLLGRAGVLVRAGSDRACLSLVASRARRRLSPDAATWALVYDGAAHPDALLARRARARVQVDGLGRLGAAVATTLAAAGVGRVDGKDSDPVRPDDVLAAGHGCDDVGRPRVTSLTRALERVLGPSTGSDGGCRASAAGAPDLVVVVRDDAVELSVADDLVHRGVAHLAVVAGADRVVVGPLVLPDRGPCLRCIHLHRRDRDPAWPQLVAQLTAAAATGGTTARAEVASATAAAGLVALQVLTHVDGVRAPLSVGRTLDLVLPDGLVERRRWAPHPRCGCTRLPGVPDTARRASTASSARDSGA